jgi:hypothetical protein
MINFYNQVPSVYPSASRDFQYLSWLINIVLNSVKHNVDDMYNLPNIGADSKLSELFALTLGFKVKRNYDQKQLIALATILPSVLKYKGTIKAVEMAAEALISTSGALGDAEYTVVDSQLRVIIPKDTTIDITLFLDLLDYILPAGMTCRVIRENRTKRALEDIYVTHRDKLYCELHKDLDWEDNNLSTGLSGLFDTELGTTEFGANFKKSGSDLVLNAGLLSNTVIPVLPGKELAQDNTVMLMSTEEDGTNKVLYAGTETDKLMLRAKKRVQEL